MVKSGWSTTNDKKYPNYTILILNVPMVNNGPERPPLPPPTCKCLALPDKACQDAELKDCSGFRFRGGCSTTQSCSYSSVTSFFVPMKQQYQSFAFSESRKVILLFSWGKVAKIICRWQLQINKMVKTVKYCWQLSGHSLRLMQRKWKGLMAFSGVN